MSSQRKLTSGSSLGRSSVSIAVLLAVAGIAVLGSGYFRFDLGAQLNVSIAEVNPTDGLCVFFLGMLLLALELGWTGAHWFASVPTAISALSLAEDLLKVDLYVDELLAVEPSLSSQPTHMSVVFSGCVLLTCLVLAWRMLGRAERAQLFAEAVTGSLVASAGSATLLGYAAGLPAIYQWGTETATSPVSAATLLLIGAGLLLRAWRQAIRGESGPPAWSPMPAVVGCLTLTLILWIGLRERERAYVNSKAQTSMDTLATSIESELQRQASAVERLARKWANSPNDEYVWEQDAVAQWNESSKNLGCVSLAVVSSELRTIWTYPSPEKGAGNGFDHSAAIARREALEAARLAGAPAISASTAVGGSQPGVVIYSPIFREGRVSGYVAAEFAYPQFFGRLVADQKLSSDYHVGIREAE